MGEKAPKFSGLDAVIQLLNPLKKKKHVIICDSYYGSFELAETLKDLGHFCIATCKANRPSFIFSNYLHKQNLSERYGSWKSCFGYFSDDVPFSCFIIRGKRLMNIISTFHSPVEEITCVEQTTNNEEEVEEEEVSIPQARRDYLLKSGYIDEVNDEIMSYYFKHRVYRWKVALFIWLVRAIVQLICWFLFVKSLRLYCHPIVTPKLKHRKKIFFEV